MLQPVEGVESRIYSLRGMRVMISNDLAQLYEIETKVLMQAVRRNLERFPQDFMFQLSRAEAENLKLQSNLTTGIDSRSQIVTLKARRGSNIKYLPYAFTEQGVAMLSSVLRSDRAVAVNIEIMRAFVRLRSMLASNKELAKKLAELERKYDHQFKVVFEAIRDLMTPPVSEKKPRIGFIRD
jgi:hypothetical protein